VRPSASLGSIPSPSTGRALDALGVDGMVVRCILGLYPSERVRPQTIGVSLTLHVDTSAVAEQGDLSLGIDYARLAGELRFLLEACRFQTLETAAQALARYVLLPPAGDRAHPPVAAVDLRLDKPEALSSELGGGTPSLSIRRYADAQRYETEQNPWGAVDVVHELRAPATGDASPALATGDGSYGIYRLRIAPRSAIPTHVHRRMHESELVLGSSLLLQGQRVAPGLAFAWPHAHPHRWENASDEEQSILCVDRPGFDPDDEVEVATPSEGLAPIEAARYYPAEEQHAYRSAS
jgi:dihydroneopterin aldolase